MSPVSFIRRNLRHIVIAAITIAFLGAITYLHVRSTAGVSHIGDAFLSSLHGPGFAFIAIFVLSVLRLYHRRPASYLHAGIVAMGIGVFSEAVQLPGPRDASASDLVLDAVGIIGGLSTFAVFDRELRSRLAKKTLVGLIVTSGLALSLTFLPTAWYAYAAVAQYRALPTLLAFEKVWERETYRDTFKNPPKLLPATPRWPEGSNTIAYTKESMRRGVLISIEPYPDWSNYSALSFVAASPNERTQDIVISIRDIRKSGAPRANIYLQEFRIGPTPTRYVIPLEKIQSAVTQRPFDVSRVSAFALLAATPRSGTELLLDDFRLEP